MTEAKRPSADDEIIKGADDAIQYYPYHTVWHNLLNLAKRQREEIAELKEKAWMYDELSK